MQTSFRSVSELLDYYIKCPLCGCRLTTECSSINPSSDVEFLTYADNKLLMSIDDVSIDIDMLTNKIHSTPSLNDKNFFIGKLCNNYHFYYKAKIVIDDNNTIRSIILHKLHFIRQLRNKTHFTVNSHYFNNETNIRMTDDMYNTAELSLPIVEFDFSKKRRMDAMLQKISILA